MAGGIVPTVTIPLTTYSIRQANPGHKYGSPAENPLRNGGAGDARMLARVPLDKIPEDASVISATLSVWTAEAATGTFNMRVHPNTESWKSSVNWNTKPARGAVIDSDSKNNPAKNAMYQFDLLAWVNGVDHHGLSIDIDSTPALKVRGSSAPVNKPVLEVEYVILPDAPSSLSPDGGAVSVGAPVLAYEPDEDIAEQNIQFSSDGTVPGITYDSGWLATTDGRYDPALDPGSNPTLTAGQSIYWRVRTNGSGGISPWSGWANYSYEPLPTVTITNPPATTDDGSPTLQWTVTGQASWKAEYYNDTKMLDSVPWDEDAVTRDWTPSRSVKVPNGSGRFVLKVRDDVTPRVATEGAPTVRTVEQTFTTTLTGAGTAINTIAVAFEEPVPVITGTRTLGIPDKVALVRNGEIVPLWDADGDPHLWAPAADFFSGNNFTLYDMTAPPRQEHTWEVRVKVGSTVSAAGPSATGKFLCKSVYLVRPENGNKVEIQGYNDVPVIEQSISEGSILHVPVQGDLIVEPVRRRLLRTTRSGSIEGAVLTADIGQLENWAETKGANTKYRLIFGRVNWSVIIGDYNPTDVFYDDECSDERALVMLNWWERLSDY